MNFYLIYLTFIEQKWSKKKKSHTGNPKYPLMFSRFARLRWVLTQHKEGKTSAVVLEKQLLLHICVSKKKTKNL